MNIKSLLLGSAAALVAVSGARAADAVMAEPEAVEYVRVCDAYGAGYFYIPGTETCLKISGRVRYQVNFNNGDKGWKKEASAMLNFTAKSDTELGTLTSYIEMSAAQKSGDVDSIYTGRTAGLDGIYGTADDVVTTALIGGLGGKFGLDHAWISLGGLKMGWTDTVYDGGLDGEGSAGGGGAVHYVSYTFTGGNGFSATLALEEETWNINYVPNVVAKVSLAQGWGGVDAWVAYDDDDNGALAGDANWSVKGRLTANVGSAGVFKALATYNSAAAADFYTNKGRWTLGASYKHTLSPKLALTGVVQYQADTNFSAVGTPNNFVFGGVVDYTAVPNFLVELAVWHNTNGAAANTTEGWLRFQRSF